MRRLKPVELLAVHYQPRPSTRRRIGRLARKERQILFEFDSTFLSLGIDLSPFRLPPRLGVVVGDPAVFGGLMGLFEDSLPDGWGRLLLDRRIAREGLSPASLGPLDRLAWVGSRGMGALVYEPERGLETPSIVDLDEIAREANAVHREIEIADLDGLIAIGGSPQGARPKALVQVSADGQLLLYGAAEIRPGFVPFLVKFPTASDGPYAGLLEQAYANMARAAGLTMPETRLLGRRPKHPGYFAARRFDRQGELRLHVHTLSGLLHAPHTYPSLTYRDLLLATRRLTRNDGDVAEIFRRACFNVLAHNRDDHSKNFAFLMQEDGSWSASPAYDLTWSAGPGGEHTMLIGGEGRSPTTADLEGLAREVGIKGARRIIDEVRQAVQRFRAFADEVGLPKRARDAVARVIVQ